MRMAWCLYRQLPGPELCCSTRTKKLECEFDTRGRSNSKQINVATQTILDTIPHGPSNKKETSNGPMTVTNALIGESAIDKSENENEVNKPFDTELPICFISSRKVFKNVDDRPHAKVSVGGIEHVKLLDSGSQATVVGKNLIGKIMPHWREHLPPPEFNISPVDECHEMVPHGMVDIEYSYIGMTRLVPTVILDVDTKRTILGQTFLKAFDIGLAKRTPDGWISIPTFSIKSGAKLERDAGQHD